MEYKIIEQEEKTVAGISARTQNQDPNMMEVIGGLWNSFFADGIYASIPNKKTKNTIGLYSNYAGNEAEAYDVTICCEAEKGTDCLETLQWRTIPAGKYAQFVLQNPTQEMVGTFWENLWQMPLDRAFTADYEEYEGEGDEKAGTLASRLNIFIALK